MQNAEVFFLAGVDIKSRFITKQTYFTEMNWRQELVRMNNTLIKSLKLLCLIGSTQRKFLQLHQHTQELPNCRSTTHANHKKGKRMGMEVAVGENKGIRSFV